MPASIKKSRTVILELIGEYANPKKLDDDEVKREVLWILENDLVKNGEVITPVGGGTGDTLINIVHNGLMVEVLTISKTKVFKVMYL